MTRIRDERGLLVAPVSALAVALVFNLFACSSSAGMGTDTGTPGSDAVVPTSDIVVPGTDAVSPPPGDGAFDGCISPLDPFSMDAPAICVVVRPRVPCGGTLCAEGQDCCLTTAQCYAPGDATACARPTTPPVMGNGGSGGPCASNSQCSADEFCASDSGRCLGSGHCQPRSNCGSCGPGPCPVCGCDGVTYPNIQTVCVAGARPAANNACGALPPDGPDAHAGPPPVIGCGDSTQCPAGASCCALTGHCYNPAEPWRCTELPDGGLLDCASNADCNGSSYCAGDGCGTPGRCMGRASDCGGELAPVCGCDGRAYANECWARNGGTRVAAAGACPDR